MYPFAIGPSQIEYECAWRPVWRFNLPTMFLYGNRTSHRQPSVLHTPSPLLSLSNFPSTPSTRRHLSYGNISRFTHYVIVSYLLTYHTIEQNALLYIHSFLIFSRQISPISLNSFRPKQDIMSRAGIEWKLSGFGCSLPCQRFASSSQKLATLSHIFFCDKYRFARTSPFLDLYLPLTKWREVFAFRQHIDSILRVL